MLREKENVKFYKVRERFSNYKGFVKGEGFSGPGNIEVHYGVRHKFFGAPKIDAKSAIFAVVPIFAPSPILDCEKISKPLAVPHNLTSLAQHVFKDRGRTRHLRAEKILRDG